MAELVIKKVLVVDDELHGLTFNHLREEKVEFLEDLTSPEVEAIWSFLETKNLGYKSLQDTPNPEVAEFLSSDNLVKEVILDEAFWAISSDSLTTKLNNFRERNHRVQQLKELIVDIFPADNFVLEFAPTRPNAADLLACHFVILDLFLLASADSVTNLKEYLKQISDAQHLGATLPPIIVMSSHEELRSNRRVFSNYSKISAAGLLILTKNEIDCYGIDGMKVIYKKLVDQIEVADTIRSFILAWTGALKDASTAAEETLWNLDAVAMQQIHYTAMVDNDPYDAHLNELISREYLWHVEANTSAAAALLKLSDCFSKSIAMEHNKPKLANRFMAPMNPKNSRTLLSHFTWLGSVLPASIDAQNEENLIKNFNTLIPFGALLINNEMPEPVCLVHITQQCDLNSASRQQDGKQHVTFTVVERIKILDADIDLRTDSLIARSLTIGDSEYDFKFISGRVISLPLAEFVKYAKNKCFEVKGRLRQDIATQFLQASVNHMTRHASQRMDRVSVKNARIYLRGANFQDGLMPFSLQTGEEITVRINEMDNQYFFPDEDAFKAAIWINNALKATYPDDFTDFSLELFLNALSHRFIDSDKLETLQCKILSATLEGAKAEAKTATGKKPALLIVTEK